MDFESKEFMVEQINELIEQARSVSADCIPKILTAMDEWWRNLTPTERCIIIRNCVSTKYSKILGVYGPSSSVRSKILKRAGIKGCYGSVAILNDLVKERCRMSTELPPERKREIEPKLKELASVLATQCSNVNDCFKKRLATLIMGQLAK